MLLRTNPTTPPRFAGRHLPWLAALLLAWAFVSVAPAATPTVAASPEGRDDFDARPNYDEVVLNLAGQLGQSPTEALDAANKLSQIGRRAVPVLSDLLQRAPNEQVKYYAALALSRIRDAGATRALLPLLSDAKAARDLRLLAVDAAGGTWQTQALAPLRKLAAGDLDDALRQKALEALSVMPEAWADCEDLFVANLDSDREPLRALAIQVCSYAASKRIVYASAEPKLLALAEHDSAVTLRVRALTALTRMKSGRTVPLIVRLLASADTPPSVAKQALAACEAITGVPLKDAAAVQTWWEKFGRARYEHAPPLRPLVPEKKAEAPAANDSGPAKAGPAPSAPRPEPENKAAQPAAVERPGEVPPSQPPEPARKTAAPRREEPKLKPMPDDDRPVDPYSGVPMGR